MNKQNFTSIKVLVFLILSFHIKLIAKSKIDPIRFSISTSASQVSLNEEFEVKISAKYLNIPANVAFVFEGSNSFRLKLIVPDGFIQTGGDFTNFVGTELNSSKPAVTYTLRGKFTSSSASGIFQLLRSHNNSDNKSTFVEVGRLSFNVNEGGEVAADDKDARIMLTGTPGFVPYMTIAQLRSGFADTAKAVFVTDAGKAGMFRVDVASTSTDDGVLTVVTGSGTKYERVFEGHVNPRWWGIQGDGTTDETTLWQAMLNHPRVKSIYFPVPKVSYRISKITIPSNKTLLFQEGSEVLRIGVNNTEMIRIDEDSNIVIKGYHVVFRDVKTNYDITSQYIGGVGIRSAKNVTIEGVTIKNVAGDGFYLGTYTNRVTNTNIRLLNINVDGANRNGISIINGDGVWIENPRLVNIRGAAPQNGIDIEPNNKSELLRGIRIINPYTANNGGGILVALAHQLDNESPVDIVIDNHVDEGSGINFTLQAVNGKVTGSVSINNPTWKNASMCGFLAFAYGAESAQVKVNNPTVINAHTNAAFYNLNAAYLFYRHSGTVAPALMGNIHVYNPTVLDTREEVKDMAAFLYMDGYEQTSKWTNVSVINPVQIQIKNPARIVETLNNVGFPVFHDAYSLSVKDLDTTDLNVRNQYGAPSSYYKLIHNKSATGLRTVTLNLRGPQGMDVTVEVKSANTLRVSPDWNWALRPLGAVNQSIQSNVIGSKIRFVKDNTLSSWTVAEISGVWTDTDGNVLYGKSPKSISTVTTNVTLGAGPSTILANVSAGSRTITLPVAANSKGQEFVIKKIDASANTVTVKPSGSELLDGVGTKVISTQWDGLRVQCDGTAWYIIK